MRSEVLLKIHQVFWTVMLYHFVLPSSWRHLPSEMSWNNQQHSITSHNSPSIQIHGHIKKASASYETAFLYVDLVFNKCTIHQYLTGSESVSECIMGSGPHGPDAPRP